MRILGLQIFPSARPSEECGHHQWKTEPQTQVPNIIDFLRKTSPFALGPSFCTKDRLARFDRPYWIGLS